MDSRIKIEPYFRSLCHAIVVSILVLMDSRIKINMQEIRIIDIGGFNPCFNG